MPRDSGGTYTLPAGNPVVTSTIISSSWANTTLTDIGIALTGSLNRSGQGAMLAGLKLFDGTIGTPGLVFATETTSGLYKGGANDFRWSIAGIDIIAIRNNSFSALNFIPTATAVPTNGMYLFTANSIAWSTNSTSRGSISAVGKWILNAPASGTGHELFGNYDTGQPAAGVKSGLLTLMNVGGGWGLVLGTLSTGDGYIQAQRTDGTGTAYNLNLQQNGGVLQYAGIELGYKSLNFRSVTGSESFSVTDNGKAIIYGGSGGHTESGYAASDGAIVTLLNEGTAAWTIAPGSGALFWYNGSGTFTSGSRTLAIAGVATMFRRSGNWYVWGTGLS